MRPSRGAFTSRVNSGEELHFLAGHDFEKPLASRSAGTLTVRSDDDALVIEATVAGQTSWARDFLAADSAGLIRSLSPGFRVDPDGERVTRMGETVHRTITAAALAEISAVTRAAYPTAQIEARNWSADCPVPRRVIPARQRWRA
ncbi:HK97 family phage prohead protease [uncultured Algimonas sp.]|uniref:HK97 family phage prohead protease n=1 Tax=uncultured Algimonas sp. TaxID=1547920 RepID=UPI002606AFCE|nr:HK97 family phage prohead protease [uncultured Algimonas sp.]